MKVYETIDENLKARLEMIDNQLREWQMEMQKPDLNTYVEFVKYAKIVTKLNKERMLLRRFL